MIPELSVLMPVFNGGRTLRLSIESVLRQTFKKFEFIIVDDGSSDGTAEAIKNFFKKDKRIKMYRNGRNMGIVDSLNFGLRKAKSNYIARIDADDVCEPTRFEKQVNFLNHNKDVVLLGTQVNFVDGDQRLKFKSKFPTGDIEIRNELFYGNNVLFHPTAIFRRVKDYYYRPTANFAEDYDLWIRLLGVGKVSILNDWLLNYRLNPKGISFSNRLKQLKITKAIRGEIIFKHTMNTAEASAKMNVFEKIYSRLSILNVAEEKHSIKWFFLKIISFLIKPSELTRLRIFRWIDRVKNPRRYSEFVHKFKN